MIGPYFYHQRIRKAVAVFGSLFNEVYVVRKNASGGIISQVKVPLSYAPKRDFIDRIAQMDAGEDQERQVAVKLPRMSFEIIGMNYDPTRQLPKMNKCRVAPDVFDGSSTQLYTPVPYAVQFQLSIYARSQDDALQVVEQILPYFTPQYTVTVKPLDDFDIKEDTPINLTGITFSDDYEAPLESRRTIIYTLDFEMKISLYKSTGAPSKIITQADVDIFEIDGDEFSTVSASTNDPASNSGILFYEDSGRIIKSTFRVRIPQATVAGFTITSQPSSGTATISFDETRDSILGYPMAVGSWTYTPNQDYYGPDSFVVTVAFVDGSPSQTVTVSVSTQEPIQDAFDDEVTFSTIVEQFIDINTGDNDKFESSSLSYSLLSPPSNGTVVLLDSNSGIFRYTPSTGFVGVDTFVYKVQPLNGISETATVKINVTNVFEGTFWVIESGDTLITEDGTYLTFE